MATIMASNVSFTEVVDAISSANTGDTVLLPAASATWDYDSTQIASVTGKNITIQGSGRTLTKINRDGGSTDNNTLINLNDTASRITGIGFVNGKIIANGAIGFIIDNCDFSATTFQIAVDAQNSIGTHPEGVVASCNFTNQRVLVRGAYSVNLATQHAVWYDSFTFGSDSFVFVEDCVFNAPLFINAIDANYGGRYVFRYNVLYDTYIEAHAALNDLDNRGTRAWEIYNNVLQETSCTHAGTYRACFLRAGTGVVWGNSATGYSNGYNIDNRRSFEGTPPPANGTSVWDQNSLPTANYQGYLCRDQIGAGGDSILYDSATATYPAQYACAAYFWDNTADGASADFSVVNLVNASGCACYASLHIVMDRDYYNGTAKPGYVPYTYPHPLRGLNASSGSFCLVLL